MYDDSAARGAWRANLVRYSVVYFMPSEDRTWRGKILYCQGEKNNIVPEGFRAYAE